MNYYPHHIGDFNNATRHLTRLERSIYLDLLHYYYDTEKPLKNDLPALCRRILATTDEELTTVERMLNEYFTLVNDEWINERCDKVISEYQNRIENASKAGIASAKARKAKKRKASKDSTTVEQPLNERGTNQNQEPKPKPETKEGKASTLTVETLPDDWLDFSLNSGLSVEQSKDQFNRFRDYWIAQPGAKGRKKDWLATWRNWIRRSKEFAPKQSGKNEGSFLDKYSESHTLPDGSPNLNHWMHS